MSRVSKERRHGNAGFNLVNVPPWKLATTEYNDYPKRLTIQGTKRSHASLFNKLSTIPDHRERSDYFQGYMDVAFRLHQWDKEGTRTGRLAIKNSYVRFLRGWMFDSNMSEGAVLKGWVESRFGLAPTYHKTRLDSEESEGYFSYLKERGSGLGRTNALYLQLDLLYEYIQFELALARGGEDHLQLYRGVFDFDEHLIEENLTRSRYRVRLNNLNSFTRDYERAWEFGTRVLAVKVPLTKIFFDGSLLHGGLLQGEEEVLVIGGSYDLKVCWY